MNLNLTDRIALISGGSRGIGLAIAHGFLAEGAKVAFFARNREQVDNATNVLKRTSGNVLGFVADASDSEQVEKVLAAIVDHWGKPDIIVCNAGDGRSIPDAMPPAANFAKSWATNFTTVENVIRTGLPHLNPQNGNIIIITSIAGLEAFGAPTDYSVAKAALTALSKNLARKLAPGIRVNCIAPGNVFFPGGSWDSKMQEKPDSVKAMLDSQVPMKRFGRPEEITDAVLFMASDRAGFITGSCFVVDGGQTVSIQ